MSSSRAFRLLSVAVLLVAVAAPEVFAQGQGRIRGRVTHEETGEPMAGVTIRADPPPDSTRPAVETVTDDSGNFQVIGLTSGQWETTVSMEGFHDSTGSVRVTQGTPSPVQFYLTRVRSALELALGDEALEGLDQVQLEADLQASDAAYNAQDYDTAIAGYEALFAVLPQMTDLHLQIGNSHRALGQFEEALAAYDLLLADDPNNVDAQNEVARTRLAMGDLDAAEGLTAVTGGLASREDLYNLGEVEFAKGDVEAAKVHFQKVVDLAPSSEDGTQARATLSALP